MNSPLEQLRGIVRGLIRWTRIHTELTEVAERLERQRKGMLALADRVDEYLSGRAITTIPPEQILKETANQIRGIMR